MCFGSTDPRLPLRFDEVYGGNNSSSDIIDPLRRDDSIKERADALGEMADYFKQSASDLSVRRFTFVCRILR